MPVHGSTPEEVLELYTRAGGSWWLTTSTNRPNTTATLSAIDPVEVPRDATAWADPSAGSVSHVGTVTLPAATADTTAAAWCLFNDEACTDLAVSRWFSEDRIIAEGVELPLTPEVLTIQFTPDPY